MQEGGEGIRNAIGEWMLRNVLGNVMRQEWEETGAKQDKKREPNRMSDTGRKTRNQDDIKCLGQ